MSTSVHNPGDLLPDSNGLDHSLSLVWLFFVSFFPMPDFFKFKEAGQDRGFLFRPGIPESSSWNLVGCQSHFLYHILGEGGRNSILDWLGRQWICARWQTEYLQAPCAHQLLNTASSSSVGQPCPETSLPRDRGKGASCSKLVGNFSFTQPPFSCLFLKYHAMNSTLEKLRH